MVEEVEVGLDSGGCGIEESGDGCGCECRGRVCSGTGLIVGGGRYTMNVGRCVMNADAGQAIQPRDRVVKRGTAVSATRG